jgi:hypothetical protein
VKTPIERLTQFLTTPPPDLSSCCVQLSIHLARLMRWIDSVVFTPTQKELFLTDFPQHRSLVLALELRLTQLKQELGSAVYAALNAQNASSLGESLQQAKHLLEAVGSTVSDVQALLQSGYTLELEDTDIDFSVKHVVAARVASKRSTHKNSSV